MLDPTCSAADGCLTGKAGLCFREGLRASQFPKTLLRRAVRLPSGGPSHLFVARSFRLPANAASLKAGECSHPQINTNVISARGCYKGRRLRRRARGLRLGILWTTSPSRKAFDGAGRSTTRGASTQLQICFSGGAELWARPEQRTSGLRNNLVSKSSCRVHVARSRRESMAAIENTREDYATCAT